MLVNFYWCKNNNLEYAHSWSWIRIKKKSNQIKSNQKNKAIQKLLTLLSQSLIMSSQDKTLYPSHGGAFKVHGICMICYNDFIEQLIVNVTLELSDIHYPLSAAIWNLYIVLQTYKDILFICTQAPYCHW